MFKRIWDHSFGNFDAKSFWKEFSGNFGAALGISAIFWPLIVYMLR